MESYLVRVREFELPAIPRPVDVRLARLVCQKFEEELPELDRSTAVIRGEEGAGQEGAGGSVALWRNEATWDE